VDQLVVIRYYEGNAAKLCNTQQKLVLKSAQKSTFCLLYRVVIDQVVTCRISKLLQCRNLLTNLKA